MDLGVREFSAALSRNKMSDDSPIREKLVLAAVTNHIRPRVNVFLK